METTPKASHRTVGEPLDSYGSIIQPLPIIPPNAQIAEGAATSRYLPDGLPVPAP